MGIFLTVLSHIIYVRLLLHCNIIHYTLNNMESINKNVRWAEGNALPMP